MDLGAPPPQCTVQKSRSPGRHADEPTPFRDGPRRSNNRGAGGLNNRRWVTTDAHRQQLTLRPLTGSLRLIMSVRFTQNRCEPDQGKIADYFPTQKEENTWFKISSFVTLHTKE